MKRKRFRLDKVKITPDCHFLKSFMSLHTSFLSYIKQKSTVQYMSYSKSMHDVIMDQYVLNFCILFKK